MDKVDEALEWVQKICIGPNHIGTDHPLNILMSELARLRAERDELRAALINLTVAVEKHDFLSCALIAQTQDALAALGGIA